MRLIDWLRDEKKRKTDNPDGIYIVSDNGRLLGEIEYKDGYLIRRTMYSKKRERNVCLRYTDFKI